tara:strand:- start:2106 stop:2417 length:312 start_codon:yes stop_codon:yes gene_type:complete
MIDEKIKSFFPDTEQVSKQEQKKEEKKVTTIKPHRGHTLYEYNVETKDLVEATFQKTDVAYEDIQKGKNLARRKVIMKGGCIYISSLNKKNALKKLSKHYEVN